MTLLWWIVITSVVCIVFAVGREIYVLRKHRFPHSGADSAFTFILVSLFGVAVVHVASIISYNEGSPTGETKDTPIKSVNINSKTEGSFFLGSGVVDEEMVYYYYDDKGSSTYKLDSIYAYHVSIKEDDSVDPHLSCPIMETGPLITGDTYVDDQNCTIYVPTGTVVEKYEVIP